MKKSTARGAGRRLAQAQNLGRRKARVGRKERLGCASLRPRYAGCASFRNGLSCAFLCTGRRYMVDSSNEWKYYYSQLEIIIKYTVF